MKKAFVPLRSSSSELRIYQRYFEYLRDLGYIPISGDMNTGVELVEDIDLLLLPGGGNIGDDDPDSRENDRIDFRLLDLYYSHNKKILGICRGLQVINVYFKGSIKKVKNHMKTDHLISGLEEMVVNSYHEVGIDRIGNGLTIEAVAPDGITEAISAERVLAFQFHPELLSGTVKNAVRMRIISSL